MTTLTVKSFFDRGAWWSVVDTPLWSETLGPFSSPEAATEAADQAIIEMRHGEAINPLSSLYEENVTIKEQNYYSHLPMGEITLTEALQAVNNSLQTLTLVLQRIEEERAWLPIKEAAPRLGVSDRWILERIRRGSYKHGVHFVNTSDGGRPNYLVSVAAIRKELAKPPEKRKSGIVPPK